MNISTVPCYYTTCRELFFIGKDEYINLISIIFTFLRCFFFSCVLSVFSFFKKKCVIIGLKINSTPVDLSTSSYKASDTQVSFSIILIAHEAKKILMRQSWFFNYFLKYYLYFFSNDWSKSVFFSLCFKFQRSDRT